MCKDFVEEFDKFCKEHNLKTDSDILGFMNEQSRLSAERNGVDINGFPIETEE